MAQSSKTWVARSSGPRSITTTPSTRMRTSSSAESTGRAGSFASNARTSRTACGGERRRLRPRSSVRVSTSTCGAPAKGRSPRSVSRLSIASSSVSPGGPAGAASLKRRRSTEPATVVPARHLEALGSAERVRQRLVSPKAGRSRCATSGSETTSSRRFTSPARGRGSFPLVRAGQGLPTQGGAGPDQLVGRIVRKGLADEERGPSTRSSRRPGRRLPPDLGRQSGRGGGPGGSCPLRDPARAGGSPDGSAARGGGPEPAGFTRSTGGDEGDRRSWLGAWVSSSAWALFSEGPGRSTVPPTYPAAREPAADRAAALAPLGREVPFALEQTPGQRGPVWLDLDEATSLARGVRRRRPSRP